MPKISDLWLEVESALTDRTPASLKMAILEAYKVLEAVLDAKGFSGRNIERKLFWAGYSLKDKNGIREAIDKRNEVLNNFQYQLSDLETEEIVKKFKHIIDEITKSPKMTVKDKGRMILETYFSLKSLSFWRNLGVFIGFFVVIKLLSSTTVGINLSSWFVNMANFIISWQFMLLIVIIIALIYALNTYLAGKSRVKIKED